MLDENTWDASSAELSASRLQVQVLSSDPLIQAGLSSVVGALPGLRLGGATIATDSAELPDVALWDAGSRLSELLPVPTLALVSNLDQARTARNAGARGLLHRDVAGERLEAALKAMAAGLTVVDPELEDALNRPPLADEAGEYEPLTEREREVLELLAEGLSNKDIGLALEMSAHTAKFHVAAILEKLGAATRTEAVVRALRMGWLEM